MTELQGGQTSTEQGPETISMTEFLESVPPSSWRNVTELWISKGGTDYIVAPDIILPCSNKICNGPRKFRAEGVYYFNRNTTSDFLQYTCSNCQEEHKLFAIRATKGASGTGEIYKYGESPPFGPPTPTRLLKLFDEQNLQLFMKGRRCESQGLGIGAFVYYRRVVENQRKQIFDSIIKVAEMVGLEPERIETLKHAAKETQFKKAVDEIKGAMPQSLLVKGQNPLTLLHGALSSHLHEKSDAECLALAQDVRILLAVTRH
jgi:hypothetical protein